jgi:hypothetical protein
MLALSGCLLWRARRLPCPSDMRLAYACQRLRRTSVALWGIAVACTVLGAMFAFAIPALG